MNKMYVNVIANEEEAEEHDSDAANEGMFRNGNAVFESYVLPAFIDISQLLDSSTASDAGTSGTSTSKSDATSATSATTSSTVSSNGGSGSSQPVWMKSWQVQN